MGSKVVGAVDCDTIGVEGLSGFGIHTRIQRHDAREAGGLEAQAAQLLRCLHKGVW